MLIAELGLNHFGDVELSDYMIDKLLKSKIDAITFQIRESEFYNGKWKNFLLPESYYEKAVSKIHEHDKLFGMAISDMDKIEFFEKINTDFYKILSKDLKNTKFLQTLAFTTKKDTFLSTGLSNFEDIDEALNILEKNTTLIHTRLSNKAKDVNLKAIETMKSKYDNRIAFGLHCENEHIIYAAAAYEPSDYFIYIKSSKNNLEAPDDLHAIEVSDIDNLIKNIKDIERSIGTGVKNQANNTIRGQQ